MGLAAGASCGPVSQNPADGVELASIAEVPAPASQASALRERVAIFREVTATVRSLDHIQVASEVTGRVLQVHAEVGDRVHRGQLLAELNSAVLRTNRDAALAAVELAQAEADRVERLFQQKVAPASERDAAQTALKQAKAILAVAETNLSYAKVEAPVDGVVEERLVGPGDLAVPGTPLYSLYDPMRLSLEAHIPVGDRDHAALGAELIWKLGAGQGQAQVQEVAPSSDPRSRTIRIRVPLPVDLKVSGEEPAPGTFGILQYPVGERERISVPKAALFRVGQVEMVLVERDGRWQRRAVRAGPAAGERIEILSGLQGRETVGLP